VNSNSWSAKNYSLCIVILFLFFVVLSNISLPGRAYRENGYIEALQAILIVSVLIVGFIRKGYLINSYSRFTYWLRQSLVSLLLFEEISYLTANRFDFLDYNIQSELNFHNSSFLVEGLVSFDFLGNDSINLSPYLLINIFFTIFFYSGDRIPFFKRFNIICLHPLVRIGILLFLFSDYGLLNIAFTYLSKNLFFLDNSFSVVNRELSELFMYIIFLLDIVIKSFPRFKANSCE